MTGKREGSIFHSALGIGINRLDLQISSTNEKIHKIRNEEGVREALNDYIFGKSEENPFEDINKKMGKEMKKEDAKFKNILRVVELDKELRSF